jgi:hypothetical protein
MATAAMRITPHNIASHTIKITGRSSAAAIHSLLSNAHANVATARASGHSRHQVALEDAVTPFFIASLIAHVPHHPFIAADLRKPLSFQKLSTALLRYQCPQPVFQKDSYRAQSCQRTHPFRPRSLKR